MIRFRSAHQLTQAAQQLADGADDFDVQALTHMVDFLEAHNAQMQPDPPPTSPTSLPAGHASAPMPEAQATFTRLKHLTDIIPGRRHPSVFRLLQSMCESMDAPNLSAFAEARDLDLHRLKIQRAHLVAQGADAYLALLLKQAEVSMVPDLRRSSIAPQQMRAPGMSHPARIFQC